jgi:hypothetical protein
MTPAIQSAMRSAADECPLCLCVLTDDPGTSMSKELDHIIPLNVGGTHTVANVRIICRGCNLRRPRDGSDYTGPVTFDMIDREFAEAIAGRAVRERGVVEIKPLDQCAPFMRPIEAAAALLTSESVLTQWRRDGTGPAYVQITPGRHGIVRYPREALRDYLAANTTHPVGAVA